MREWQPLYTWTYYPMDTLTPTETLPYKWVMHAYHFEVRSRMIWVWLRWYRNTFQSSQYFWKIDVQVYRERCTQYTENTDKKGPGFPDLHAVQSEGCTRLDCARCQALLPPGLESPWAMPSQIWALKYVARTSPRTTQLWSWSPGCNIHITNQDVLSEDEWTNGRSKLTFWITGAMGPPYGRGWKDAVKN